MNSNYLVHLFVRGGGSIYYHTNIKVNSLLNNIKTIKKTNRNISLSL